ncbi:MULTISPECIES: bifunctional DNA primase/polymerase [unclassified Streptomyces]|uniref:bifunctional DNA primase/polymerase n=1 Tax=unclassified Streptomyces TaxID=2593676 RepID=UPI0036E99712
MTGNQTPDKRDRATDVTRTIPVPRQGENRGSAPRVGAVSPHAVARWCAAQGWPVHPLAPGRKTPAGNCPDCKAHRHHPTACPCLPAGRPCHGFHAASQDPERIDRWWTDSPSSGVGVACGPAELVVIDVDSHAAPLADRSRLLPGIPIPDQVKLDGLASGFDTLALLAAYRGEPDPAQDDTTLRVHTPSGGLHIWYRNPDPATRFRCSTGAGSRAALAWQVDVRAEGGYIIAPGIRTRDGVYRPVGPSRTPSPLPGWLRLELARTGHVIASEAASQPPAPRGAPRTPSSGRTRRPAAAEQVMAPLIAEVADCARVPEGNAFTEKLNRAAYTAGGLIGAGHLEHAVIRDRLVRVAHHARPWQQARNETIVDDALAVGSARPLHLGGRP